MAFGDEVMPNHEYLTSVCTCADRLVNMSNPWFMKTWILVCLGLNFLDNRLILSTRWLIIQNRIIIKRKPKKDVVQKLQKQIANPLSYDTSNCQCQCFDHITCFGNTAVKENSKCRESHRRVTDGKCRTWGNKVAKARLDASSAASRF